MEPPFYQSAATIAFAICPFQPCIDKILTGDFTVLRANKSIISLWPLDTLARSHFSMHLHSGSIDERKSTKWIQSVAKHHEGKKSSFDYAVEKNEAGQIICGIYGCDETFDQMGMRLRHLALDHGLKIFVNRDGKQLAESKFKAALQDDHQESYKIWSREASKTAIEELFTLSPAESKYIATGARPNKRRDIVCSTDDEEDIEVDAVNGNKGETGNQEAISGSNAGGRSTVTKDLGIGNIEREDAGQKSKPVVDIQEVLINWCKENPEMKPTETEKKALRKATGLNRDQLSAWLQKKTRTLRD